MVEFFNRKTRKLDHLRIFSKTEINTEKSVFDDVHLIHQSVSNEKPDNIDISVEFLGKKLDAPIIINAITGGHPDTIGINRILATAARKTGIAMAVGSQKAALEDYQVRDTFAVARDKNPEGLLLANLSASCFFEEAVEAVKMIRADGLQLHLNQPQELFMPEGDSTSRDILTNIKHIAQKANFPVIAKEVGFGMAMESICALYNAGINLFDISGKGGTNFIAIENIRSGNSNKEFENWGIPTAVSLIEGVQLDLPIKLIASGGLKSSADIAKALVIGAEMTAIAGPILRELSKGSVDDVIEYIEGLKIGLKKIMIMIGATRISDFSRLPVVITGETAEWSIRRGTDINYFAQRNFGNSSLL
ncbi:MAG: type 2 isopentenyl-diphosphate Delta-isomerase [Peptococcaceae bacterium]|nr:type 2 isopentenyl-diphosphate Delta-isomerase [Peptococcaceae bacterium]